MRVRVKVATLARVPSGSMPWSRSSLRSLSAEAKSLFRLASTHWMKVREEGQGQCQEER